MKAEKEILAESAATNAEHTEIQWPEPQTELGAKLIALAKEIENSNLPKLSTEEIEEYIGRELGCIAAAYGDTIRK